MNVRLVMHRTPNRSELYGGIQSVYSNGEMLILSVPEKGCSVRVALKVIKEILLDDEPGDWW